MELLEAEFINLLREIHRLPGALIGGSSFDRLCGFIDGFLYARLVPGASDFPLLVKFRDWLRVHTGIDHEAGWEQFIRFYSTTDGMAFDQFFHHFEVFLRDTSASGGPAVTNGA